MHISRCMAVFFLTHSSLRHCFSPWVGRRMEESFFRVVSRVNITSFTSNNCSSLLHSSCGRTLTLVFQSTSLAILQLDSTNQPSPPSPTTPFLSLPLLPCNCGLYSWLSHSVQTDKHAERCWLCLPYIKLYWISFLKQEHCNFYSMLCSWPVSEKLVSGLLQGDTLLLAGKLIFCSSVHLYCW